MMRPVIGAVLATAMLWPAAPASAQGIPVFDGQNYAQILLQVSNAGKQLAQLEQTYNQLQSSYSSFSKLTSAASIADVLNNSAVRNLLPPEVTNMATLLSGNPASTGALGALAKQFQTQYGLPAAADATTYSGSVNDAYSSYLSSLNGGAANMLALGSNTLAIANSRTTGLSQIQSRIGTDAARDPKEAMDLNVRATIENAQATNDLIKLQSIQMSEAAQSDMLLKQYWASRSRSANAAEYQAVSALTAQ